MGLNRYKGFYIRDNLAKLYNYTIIGVAFRFSHSFGSGLVDVLLCAVEYNLTGGWTTFFGCVCIFFTGGVTRIGVVRGGVGEHSCIHIMSFTTTLTTILIATSVYNGIHTSGCGERVALSRRQTLARLSKELHRVNADLGGKICSDAPPVLDNVTSRLSERALTTGDSLSILPLRGAGLRGACGFLSRINSFARALGHGITSNRDVSSRRHRGLHSLVAFYSTLSKRISGVHTSVFSKDFDFSRGDNRLTLANRGARCLTNSVRSTRRSLDSCPALVCSNPFSSRVVSTRPGVADKTGRVSGRGTLSTTTTFLNYSGGRVSFLDRRSKGIPTCYFSRGGGAITMAGGNKCIVCVLSSSFTNRTGLGATSTLGGTSRFLSSRNCTSVGRDCCDASSKIYAMGCTCGGSNIVCCPSLVGMNMGLRANSVTSFSTGNCVVGRARHGLDSSVLPRTRTRGSIDKLLAILSSGETMVPAGDGNRGSY